MHHHRPMSEPWFLDHLLGRHDLCKVPAAERVGRAFSAGPCCVVLLPHGGGGCPPSLKLHFCIFWFSNFHRSTLPQSISKKTHDGSHDDNTTHVVDVVDVVDTTTTPSWSLLRHTFANLPTCWSFANLHRHPSIPPTHLLLHHTRNLRRCAIPSPAQLRIQRRTCNRTHARTTRILARVVTTAGRLTSNTHPAPCSARRRVKND